MSVKYLDIIAFSPCFKTTFAFNAFEQWYAKGNRIPSDETVEIYDFNGTFANYKDKPEEDRIKITNFIYYMCKYENGYPYAKIVKKI